MTHTYRFLGQPLDENTWQIRDAKEVFHLKKVLKLPLGGTVEVTDLSGHHIVGTYAGYDAATSICLIKAQEKVFSPLPANRMHIAIGALKPGFIDEFLAALVELSIDKISIFNQEGSHKKNIHAKSHDRWERIILASVKQCKRSRAPELEVFPDLTALLKSSDFSRAENKYFLDAEAPLHSFPNLKKPEQFVFLVGSEKGLLERELVQLRAEGFVGLSLGDTILRATTAIIALASLTLINR